MIPHLITGLFMLAEISLNAVGTLIAVVIMYLHVNAAYDEPVPSWLLTITCTKTRIIRASKRPYSDGDA
jgi:hypothetical protein